MSLYVKVVSTSLVRLVFDGGFLHPGLIPGQTLTISLAAGAAMMPDIVLPDQFQPQPYQDVSLEDSIDVSTRPASIPPTTPPAPPTVAVPVAIVKTGGGDPAQFLIRIRNQSTVDSTGPIEIYIRFH